MSYFKFILTIVALLAIDLISKYMFYDLDLLPNIRTPTLNTGISFSIAFNQLIVEIISLLFIISIIIATHKQKLNNKVAVLLVAWALGNLIDRVMLGGVRDFIWLGRGPIFNIADIYISAGVLWYGLIEMQPNKQGLSEN